MLLRLKNLTLFFNFVVLSINMFEEEYHNPANHLT